jgi:hypothetical protein
MAWFYNPISQQDLKIGLVAASRRHSGPPAAIHPKSAFFLRNSQIRQIDAYRKYLRNTRFSMACSSTPILSKKAAFKKTIWPVLVPLYNSLFVRLGLALVLPRCRSATRNRVADPPFALAGTPSWCSLLGAGTARFAAMFLICRWADSSRRFLIASPANSPLAPRSRRACRSDDRSSSRHSAET